MSFVRLAYRRVHLPANIRQADSPDHSLITAVAASLQWLADAQNLEHCTYAFVLALALQPLDVGNHAQPGQQERNAIIRIQQFISHLASSFDARDQRDLPAGGVPVNFMQQATHLLTSVNVYVRAPV